MSESDGLPKPPRDSTYIADPWDYPRLTVAFYGMQIQSPEAYAQYEAAGIPQQMEESLAHAEGLLGVRRFPEGNGGVLLQCWRSHEDLARYSRIGTLA